MLFSCPDITEYIYYFILSSNDVADWLTYCTEQQTYVLFSILYIKLFLISLK